MKSVSCMGVYWSAITCTRCWWSAGARKHDAAILGMVACARTRCACVVRSAAGERKASLRVLGRESREGNRSSVNGQTVEMHL